MKIIVDSQQTLQLLLTVCGAAGASQDLPKMKAALVVAESAEIANIKTATKKPKEKLKEPT